MALLLAACAISLVMVRGEPKGYLFFWRIIAGTATVVLTLTIGVEALGHGRWRAIRSAWTLLLALTVAVGSGSFAQQVAAADGPVNPFEPIEASILAQLHLNAQPDGPALVRAWGNTIDGLAVGLIDQLAREGRPVFVDRSLGFEFGEGRTATTRDVRWVLVVTEESALYSTASTRPGARVVAVSHPLPDAQQNELVGLQRHLVAILVAHGKANLLAKLSSPFVRTEFVNVPGISLQELQRLAQLNSAVRGTRLPLQRHRIPVQPVAHRSPTATGLGYTSEGCLLPRLLPEGPARSGCRAADSFPIVDQPTITSSVSARAQALSKPPGFLSGHR